MDEKIIESQLKKVLKLSKKFQMEHSKLYNMCYEHYGDVSYNDANDDFIIDTLDYGLGNISFKEFNKIMKEINKKE